MEPGNKNALRAVVCGPDLLTAQYLHRYHHPCVPNLAGFSHATFGWIHWRRILSACVLMETVETPIG